MRHDKAQGGEHAVSKLQAPARKALARTGHGSPRTCGHSTYHEGTLAPHSDSFAWAVKLPGLACFSLLGALSHKPGTPVIESGSSLPHTRGACSAPQARLQARRGGDAGGGGGRSGNDGASEAHQEDLRRIPARKVSWRRPKSIPMHTRDVQVDRAASRRDRGRAQGKAGAGSDLRLSSSRSTSR